MVIVIVISMGDLLRFPVPGRTEKNAGLCFAREISTKAGTMHLHRKRQNHSQKHQVKKTKWPKRLGKIYWEYLIKLLNDSISKI